MLRRVKACVAQSKALAGYQISAAHLNTSVPHVHTILALVDAAEGQGVRIAHAHIEDAATGNFYELNATGLWSRLTSCCRSGKVRMRGGACCRPYLVILGAT